MSDIRTLCYRKDIDVAGGSIKGLRARGGFEIIEIEWKNGRLIKAVIKSTLGGNLRLLMPVTMKLSNGAALKKAVGENTNAFYQLEKMPDPVVSDKAKITLPELKTSFLYDISTQPGKIYILIAK
jgi:alpha-L-fucosidase 2